MYGYEGLGSVADHHDLPVLALPVELLELELLLVVVGGGHEHDYEHCHHDREALDPVHLRDRVALGVELGGLRQHLVDAEREGHHGGTRQQQHGPVLERLAHERPEALRRALGQPVAAVCVPSFQGRKLRVFVCGYTVGEVRREPAGERLGAAAHLLHERTHRLGAVEVHIVWHW